ncbi:MAG: hypothetical protein IJO48_06525, partial [Clostridia bacterium]|nr:hypothetical protein [Clostridia bacterium]
LISYLEQIDARNLEHIYCEATSVMTVAKGIDAYITAADLFKSISHYKDSQKLEAHCREKATAAARKANRKKRINSTLVLIVIIICVFAVVSELFFVSKKPKKEPLHFEFSISDD